MFKVLTHPMEFVDYGLKSASLEQNDFLQISEEVLTTALDYVCIVKFCLPQSKAFFDFR